MKPYYEDSLTKIYNCSSFIFKSDVVVLDPPAPLGDSNIFDAKIYYIFAGNNCAFYEEQFPDKPNVRVKWKFSVPEDNGQMARVFTDYVLMVGTLMGPGPALYKQKVISERFSKWERPLEFALNLIAESDGDVLDPFMGTGAFLVAAKMMGRKSIGFDTDEKCCEIVAKRLMEV